MINVYIFIVISVVIRCIVFFFINNKVEHIIPEGYYYALTNHFIEYILYAPTLPDTVTLMDGLLFNIFTLEDLNNFPFILIRNFILDILSLIFIYLICMKIQLKRSLFIIMIITSISLIPFEI